MANWRRLPFAAGCAVAVAVVGADASCLLAVLAFANLLLAKTRTRPLLGRPRLTPAAAAPAGRQAHWPQRGLAGPYSLWARLAVVWLCIHSTAPAPRCCRCGGWTGRGTLCLRLPAAWPCPAPLTDTRCTHVRAGLLLLLAVVRPTTGSLLPSPSPNQYHCLSRCGTRASPSLLVLPLSSPRLHGRSKKEATCAVRRTPAAALPPACPW